MIPTFAPVKELFVLFLLAFPFVLKGQEGDSIKTSLLDEVVITGQFEPQSARKSVYQVKTIPLERIAARGAVRLQDVLNTELNIRFSQIQSLIFAFRKIWLWVGLTFLCKAWPGKM